jgi:hypothetical protein
MFEDETRMQLFEQDYGENDLYMSFNLREKLRGSFVEEAGVLSTAAGRPWLTLNEARAERNLPPIPGGDQVVVPLNVLEGGQPAPNQPLGDGGDRQTLAQELIWKGLRELMTLASGEEGRRKDIVLLPAAADKARSTADLAYPRIRARHAAKYREVLSGYFARQQRSVGALLGAKMAAPVAISDEIRSDRWDRELSRDLLALAQATADSFGERFARQSGGSYDSSLLAGWLAANSQRSAARINEFTARQVEEALASPDHPAIPDGVNSVFEIAAASRAAQIALTKVSTVANFATHEAAKQSGWSQKTWSVQSDNPRASHADMDGESVPLEEAFSNGLRFPGDPEGDADEVAGCTCTLSFSRDSSSTN